MELTIKTNNHVREYLYSSEVPDSVIKDDYSHLDENDNIDGWIHYRNNYYHISDFMIITGNHPDSDFKKWDGYISDSAFSGIVLKHAGNYEDGYIIGTYYS